MENDPEFVEYYITCNPPLLPNGVDWIMQKTQTLVDHDMITEILYEPDVPWFKCISTVSDRSRVTQEIETLLLDILREDTQPPNTNAMTLVNAYDRESQADVNIVGTNPRVLTWASFKTRGEEFLKEVDQYCYPLFMRHLRFKTRWRGIEDWQGGTFEKLLAAFKSLVKDDNVPLLAEDFADWVKCQAVSFNVREDMVYVGSNESETAVQNAIDKLENILALVIPMPRQVTHCIVLPSKTPSRVMYRWMSHLGLSQATYARALGSSLVDEYRLLLGAATLRTETLDSLGQLQPDQTVYQQKNLLEPDQCQPFKPFQGHAFPMKNADGPLKRLSEASESTKTISFPTNSGPLRPGKGKKSHGRSTTESFKALAEIPPGTGKSCSTTNGKSSINYWSNDAETAYTQEQDLISFEDEPEAVPAEDSTPSVKPASDSEDLICFDDEPVRLKPASKLEGKSRVSAITQHNNNSEDDADAVVNFGLLDEVPKDFYRMMGQKASRDISKTRKTAATQENRSTIKAPKWSDVAAQSGQAGMLIPLTAPREPANASLSSQQPLMERSPAISVCCLQADERWPRLGGVPVSPGKPRALVTARAQASQISYSQAVRPDSRACLVPQPPRVVEQYDAKTWDKSSLCQFEDKTNRPHLALPARPERPTSCPRDVLQEAKLQVRHSAAVLKMTPGKISLELAFGRIYLKQFSPSQVFSGSGPVFDADETTDCLNSADFRQDLVGFSPLLTTMGEDANRLAEMRPSADAKWRLASTRSLYDFSCVFNDGQRPFRVEVDADTLSYEIGGAREELLAVYLHCPRQAWDMKIRALRSTPLEGMARHESFAKALVAAMSVSSRGASLTIGTPGAGRLEGRVESVQVRQVARYLDSRKGVSQLAITMVTTMERGSGRRGGAGPAATRDNIWVRRTAAGSGAIPCRWFEAAITSTRAEGLFGENRSLELGRVASWGAEQLESEGILDDMCEPGVKMIEQMDEVGRGNNNEQRLDARDAFQDGLMEQPARRDQRPYDFW